MALTSSGYFEKNNFSYRNVGTDPDEKKNSKCLPVNYQRAFDYFQINFNTHQIIF